MDDILVLARIVLGDPLALGVGAALAVLFSGVWLWLVRGCEWSLARTVAAVLSSVALGMALAIVLARGAFSFRGSWYCLSNPGLGAVAAEEALNLVLYLPAAFFAVLAASVFLLRTGRRRPQEEPQDCVGVGAAD